MSDDTGDADGEPVTVTLSKQQAVIGGAAIILLAAAVFLPGTDVAGVLSSDASAGTAGPQPESDLSSTPEQDATDTQSGDGSDGETTSESGLFGESNASVARSGTAHEHAVFVVAIDGQRIDFSRRQFQMRSQKVHFENGNGDVIHKHAEGVTIDYALNTLGMDLTEDCLRLGTQHTFCDDSGRLSVTANNKTVPRWYEISNDDTIIISYTSDGEG